MSENRDLARSLLAAARRRARVLTKNGREQARNRKDESPLTESGEYQGPQLLGESLDELIVERGWSEKVRDSDLFAQWAELLGAEIADHVHIVSFTAGVLVVSAESTAWATQLRLIEGQILQALEKGGFVVGELVIKGPSAPSWRKGGWSVKGGRGPRDTYG